MKGSPTTKNRLQEQWPVEELAQHAFELRTTALKLLEAARQYQQALEFAALLWTAVLEVIDPQTTLGGER